MKRPMYFLFNRQPAPSIVFPGTQSTDNRNCASKISACTCKFPKNQSHIRSHFNASKLFFNSEMVTVFENLPAANLSFLNSCVDTLLCPAWNLRMPLMASFKAFCPFVDPQPQESWEGRRGRGSGRGMTQQRGAYEQRTESHNNTGPMDSKTHRQDKWTQTRHKDCYWEINK